MDAALLNLLVTLAVLAATVAFRKRIMAALGRLLFTKAIEFARATYLVEEEVEGPDGVRTRKIGLSGPARAILAAIVPLLIAEVAKTIKIRPGGLPNLPPGVDLSNLSEALPAILPMLPKRYQGIAALAAPFLQGFLGKKEDKEAKPSETVRSGRVTR